MGIKVYLFLIVALFTHFYHFTTFCQQTKSEPPTYWENYMSFKIGNYFEYEYNGGLYRYSRRIVGDTIVQSNGHHYYKIEFISPIASTPSYQFERIDSTGDWFMYYSGTQQQCLIYRLNVPLGTHFLDGCGGVNNRILQDTFSINTILGNYGPFTVKKYHLEGLAQRDDYIARKFQVYYWFSYEVGNYCNLVGAIIDSVIYGSISGIPKIKSGIPTEYKLVQNYPNPFNPLTVIKLQSPEYALIKLSVFDVLGREIRILYEGFIKPGEYLFEFNGTDLVSGIYFCMLQSIKYIKTINMALIK